MNDPFVRPGVDFGPHVDTVMLRNEGTLTSDASKREWVAAQHRDTLAGMLQRRDQLQYVAVAEGVASARMHRMLLERLAAPTQPPKRARAADKP